MILSGTWCAQKAGSPWRRDSVGLLATLALAFRSSQAWTALGWHTGTVERLAAYPLPLWLTWTGLRMLNGRHERDSLQRTTIPLRQRGPCFIGAFEEGEQCFVGRGLLAQIFVEVDELTQGSVVAGLCRLDRCGSRDPSARERHSNRKRLPRSRRCPAKSRR